MILPEPIARRTRATAVLRRPVPRNSEVVSAIEKRLARDSEGCWGLGSVRMLTALVHFQFGEQLPAEPVFRKHAFDGVVAQLCRMLGANLRYGAIFLAALPAGVAHVLLVRFLLAGEDDLGGIDHHDKSACIQMRGVNG